MIFKIFGYLLIFQITIFGASSYAAKNTSPSINSGIQLYGVNLKNASRNEMRSTLNAVGMIPTREDDAYWVDQYNVNGLLDLAKSFEVGYTNSGNFAYAEYTFPTFMDSDLIVKVANFVAQKYGKPTKRSGNTNLGDASFTWNFKNGMRIVVYRGWPDTTTYLRYVNPTAQTQMNAEIDRVKRERVREKAQQQADAF